MFLVLCLLRRGNALSKIEETHHYSVVNVLLLFLTVFAVAQILCHTSTDLSTLFQEKFSARTNIHFFEPLFEKMVRLLQLKSDLDVYS